MPNPPVTELVLYRRQPWTKFALLIFLLLAIAIGQIFLLAFDETGEFGMHSLF